ncbi:hypothetical protein [Rhizobacter sp. P5_C2]
MSDDFLAPPAFKPDETLVTLKRQLRELKPLAERGAAFDWKGKPVLQLASDAAAITARIARRPITTPEWDTQVLKSGADVRKLVDEMRKRLARWADDE